MDTSEDPVRTPNRIIPTFLCLFLLLPVNCLTAAQTRQTVPQPPAHTGDLSAAPEDGDDARARVVHDMEKKAAKDRVAALRTDTDRLLKLSVELKSYVDKSDENVLSLDVIKKAEEIEKLAKSVKDKMKGPN
jgi:hypothetical protein